MRLGDPSLYWKLFLNPELHAGEAYMDGRMSFPDSSLREFLTLFSVNRLSLSGQPTQAALRRVSRGLKRFQQANPIGRAQANVAHHYDLGNDLLPALPRRRDVLFLRVFPGCRTTRWRRRRSRSAG